ncbi:MAG: uracil-DNA glycosylase [Chitinivibrionales bacterium]|nr:uracil-DNA glycosylase [Chitinivibrionales bacterium]
MNDSFERVKRYFRQQAELSMPDFIFSCPFDSHAVELPVVFETIAQDEETQEQPQVQERDTGYIGKAENDTDSLHSAGPDGGFGKRELLKKLYYEFRQCSQCPLGKTRNKFIFGAGNAGAAVLIIGEAPGADEDAEGLPFVGKAGQLLTRMLKAIDLDRKKDVFITNILKCRPPGNRNPETSEITRCIPLLRRQVEIIRPEAILLLGRIAAHSLLESTDSISMLRAEKQHYNGIPVIVTYHPAALLRNERYKYPAWEDLQRLRDLLKERGVYAENGQE